MKKIILVDEDKRITDGLTKLIPWDNYNLQVVGTGSSIVDAISLLSNAAPDVMMTDINFTDRELTAYLPQVIKQYPNTKIIILTSGKDFEQVKVCLNNGVLRYLSKPTKVPEIEEALLFIKKLFEEEERIRPKLVNKIKIENENFIVRQAEEFIRENATKQISLEDTAEACYVTKWHLSKLFAKQQKKFYVILNTERINLAKELILDPAKRLLDISQDLGYTDAGHFTRVFKQFVGVTPNEYRMLKKK